MDWASNLFVVLLLMDMTGTIFFLLGRVIMLKAKNDVVFLRFLTMTTLFAYLVPFVTVVLYLGKRITMMNMDSNIDLFYGTPFMLQLSAALGCAWTGMFLALLIHRLYRRHVWTEICKGNIPEEDENIIRIFEDVCAGFEIGGEVSLCRNDSVGVPCITYYHGYIVILPLKWYTEKEAEIIFYHELCHYLHKDLHLKTIGCIAALLHVFNPVVHSLMKELDMLCERCCDRAACKKGENRFTMKEYFQVIFDSLVDDGKQNRYQLFALAENKSDCERRVEYMKDYHAKGGLKKGTAVVLAACFLLGSSVTALAAGNGVTDVYQGLAETTKVKSTSDGFDEVTAENLDDEILQELVRDFDFDPEKVVFMDDDIETYADTREITWHIEPGWTYVSSGFNQVVGDEVLIVVEGTPEELEYETGIKDPKAVMHYVEGSGTVFHNFLITKKGRHYFYVYNPSETEELAVEAWIHR